MQLSPCIIDTLLCGVSSIPCMSSILSHLRMLNALKLLVLFACMPSHCSPNVCGLSFQVQGVFNNENKYRLPLPTPFTLLLCLTDIKRLAEKEDWVVDNEGLTSLVGILVSVADTFFETDFYILQNLKYFLLCLYVYILVSVVFFFLFNMKI